MPNDPGETAALLRSLYPSHATRPFHQELQYFKVISLQPSCGTSCAIDFMKTQVMLEVSVTVHTAEHVSGAYIDYVWTPALIICMTTIFLELAQPSCADTGATDCSKPCD